ncbi:MAG: GH31 [uncultured Solirubrobacteraceae bacterium]|uniref:GH31 n=1 Tax=uncultured Solirubrobacteraceae bacterium TaxID=1162706 RepID=A0A6J4SPA9_9ACTN|nr:MAG: GH31 [uncultured Solirubrobacteraceae bacterium]
MIDTARYLRFERVDAVEETARGLLADLHGEQLRVDLVRPDVVRLKLSRGGAFDESPTFAVCVDPLEADVPFEVEREEGVVRLRAAGLVVSLGLDPFRLDVHRPDGSPVLETAEDEDGRPWAYATLNDAFAFRRRCRPEDAIYGLGEKTGRHDRRGRELTLWNTDVLDPNATADIVRGLPPGDPRADPEGTEFDPYYISIPLLHHHAHATGAVAGSFVDNGYRGTYDLSAADGFGVHFAGGQYTEYVFAGPRMADVLEGYTWLTGRTAAPPLWALGFHQCRWKDYTQEDIEAIARRHREHEVPCDALWLDIEHMDGYRVFTWDPEAFPDPAAMSARLAGLGFHLVTIVDPGVKREPGYPVFDEGVARDVLCRTEGGDVYVGQVWPGGAAFPDLATEEGRAWWAERNAAHARTGVAGIWNDMNEPATGDIPPGAMRFERGRSSHERFHNQYALLMAMATTAGLRDAEPGRRTFVLSRAGSPGIQRYAATWMGDNVSRWDHLRMSIPMAMGLGLSGQAFVGADVGGFRGHTSAELLVRWTQYGALTPFCRNHSEIGNVDQYAWSFGDVVLGHVRAAIALRYRLLPYLYAAFVLASETGAPVQRPLVFDHQDDPLVRELDDEYLLGPDLLVAPVTEPGQTARQVYLPAGDWHDWHTGEQLAGAAHVLAPTPMDRIPLYARGGAVIPMWPQAPASASGHQPAVVELHLFVPRADGTHRSLLQEDDGETDAALDGARVRTWLGVTRRGARVELRAQVEGDGYPEHAREAFHLVVHGAAPARVRLDGAELAAREGRFVLPSAGTGFLVELEV